jgi:hypothetical protein
VDADDPLKGRLELGILEKRTISGSGGIMLGAKTLLVVVFLLPTVVFGQSLGEVAKKEKKRREKNQEKGVQARVVDEDEVSTEEGDATASAESESEESAVESKASSATSPTIDRRREESEWRRRIGEVRQRLNAARERHDFLSSLHLNHGEYYVDEKGHPAITSLEQLRRLIGEAEIELDAATEAMENLREEARRAGIPSGWFR